MKTAARREIQSLVQAVPIAGIKDRFTETLEHFFSPEEKKFLITRPVQTTAGFVALKQALCLFTEELFSQPLAPHDITIRHLANGAPAITALPPELTDSGLRQENLFISISHTRDHAYGLVVYAYLQTPESVNRQPPTARQ